MEHSRKRSSDKSIMLGQQKASCIIQYELTSENPALREVDLESCVKRGADRTEAQGSFYWLSWSLMNPIKVNLWLTLKNCLNFERRPIKVLQIPCSLWYQIQLSANMFSTVSIKCSPYAMWSFLVFVILYYQSV